LSTPYFMDLAFSQSMVKNSGRVFRRGLISSLPVFSDSSVLKNAAKNAMKHTHIANANLRKRRLPFRPGRIVPGSRGHGIA
jgi:hypothetical protein